MTSIWTGDGGEVVNADNTYKAERFVATEGQTVFVLTGFVYVPGTGSLLVYVSGADNYLGVHYEETDASTVTFLNPLHEDDEVVIRGLVGSIATETAVEAAAQAEASAVLAEQAYQDTLALTPASLPLPVNKGGTGQITKALALQALLSFPEERTGNTLLAKADIGKTIKYTSGTFTQTFDDVATLGAGWYVILDNSGTGDITLQPDGFEQIDARTNYKMYPFESRLVYVNQAVTGLDSLVIKGYQKVFAASDTWVKPPGYASHPGEAWSGAASGQRTNSVVTRSLGGGGAGYVDFELLSSACAVTEVVTIGAGGVAVTGAAVGNVGGTTTFGSLVSVFAGATFSNGGSVQQGLLSNFAANNLSCVGYEGGRPASVGTTDGGILAVKGGSASVTVDGSSVIPTSVWGGAAGGSCGTTGTSMPAGTSKFGGNGGQSHSTTNGEPGQVPGGGGGATQTGASSGPGARGELRIRGRA